MSILKERKFYKPFTYPQFYTRWLNHEKHHWLPAEVPMNNDVYDWNNKLTENQKHFLTNIFRFFTQGDIDIANAYYKEYLPHFNIPEVVMMLGGFASREAIHIDAYAYLIETLGMPESTYSEFLQYAEMRNKHEYIKKFSTTKFDAPNEHLAASMALFSAFTEGMQLFSTFAMLLIFPLNGLMKGMGKIIEWSMVDETHHTNGMIELFNVFVSEHVCDKHKNVNNDNIECPECSINQNSLREIIMKIANDMVELEDSFIDMVFSKYMFESEGLFGLTNTRLKSYIRYIVNMRLKAMKYEPLYAEQKNPLPELETMIDAPVHTNFFENTSTDYVNVSTTGSWQDVWK
jgi:ribonucleoside-diphosphate reductase beta chain